MRNYLKTAAFETAFILTGSMFANLFGYLSRMVLSRILNPEDFGLFYSVIAFFFFSGILTELGFMSAMVKYLSHYRALNKSSELTSVLFISCIIKFSLSLLVAASVFFLSPVLANNYFKSQLAVPLLKFVAVYLLISAFASLISNVLLGFRKMFIYAFMEPVTKLIFLIGVTVPSLFFGFRGILVPAMAFLVSMLSFILFIKPILNIFKMLKLPPIFSIKIFQELKRFAIPSLLNNAGFFVIGYIDVLILTNYRSLGEVGVYNAVLPTSLILTLLAGSMAVVFFPIASELWAKGLKKRLIEGIKLLYLYVPMLVLPFVVLIVLFSKELLHLLFGNSYVAGAQALTILAIGVILVSFFKVNEVILRGIGAPIQITYILLLASLINLLLNLVFIPKYGMNGAALTTTLSYFLMMALSFWRIRKVLPILIPYSAWLKIVFSGMVFAAIVVIVSKALQAVIILKVAISTFCGFVTYITFLNALGVLKIRVLRNTLREWTNLPF